MTWINQPDEDSGAPGTRPYAVPVTMPTDGIGDALRTAYLPRAHDLPDDFMDMLDRLH